jgi:DNA-binding NtrC family response regulator
VDNPEHLLPPNPDQPVVLVVDDEVLILNIARIALENDGDFVLTAQNGEQALEVSRRFPGRIHAVVSDVMMPKMDGLRLREHIITERPATNVLLMSGNVEAPPEGCPFLAKPFQIGVLKERVRQLLASPSQATTRRLNSHTAPEFVIGGGDSE